MAPLLVLVIAIAGLVGGGNAAHGLVMAEVQDLLGTEGRQFVQSMIENAAIKPAGVKATIVGLITLLVAALGVFNELQNALNRIWRVRREPVRGLVTSLARFVSQRLLSFSLLLVIGFLLLVFLVIGAALAALGDYLTAIPAYSQLVLQVLNLGISLGIITFLFALIFKFIPDIRIAWRNVWPGAAVTAVLFTAGKHMIGLYLGRSDVGSAFGAAGTLALIMLWIYYSSQILFLGAEFTRIYAKRFGAAPLPEDGQPRP